MAGPFTTFPGRGQHQPVFRVGESPLWASWVFSGSTKTVIFPFADGRNFGQNREIHAVTWEIYTDDKKDLIDLMWTGELNWEFVQVRVPIGPVSLFNGSFYDVFFSQGAGSDLEELARVKGEDEWRSMCQTFLIGKTHLFRGLNRYEKTPILLPAHASWIVRLDFPDATPFTPRGDTRMRVVLNGHWRNIVEFG